MSHGAAEGFSAQSQVGELWLQAIQRENERGCLWDPKSKHDCLWSARQ